MMTILRLSALLWLLLGTAALAQTLVDADTTVETTDVAPALIAGQPADGWTELAQRAEHLVETDKISLFALGRIRDDLVAWRDVFADALDVNRSRLATIETQLAALGDTDGASQTILARKAELRALQTRLLEPQILANEAFARANGLITEVDRRQRGVETARMLVRSETPANPVHWPAALMTVQGLISGFVAETWAIGRVYATQGGLLTRLVMVSAALLIGGFMVTRVRAWLVRMGATSISPSRKLSALASFVLSVLGVVLPFVAIFFVTRILLASDLFGLVGERILAAVPVATAIVLATKWFADQYFPIGPAVDGMLGYSQNVRSKARRMTSGIGWTLAVNEVLNAAMTTTDVDYIVSDVVNLPLHVLAGIFLWRLGGLIATGSQAESPAWFNRGRLRIFFGRAAQVSAFVGPFGVILGFGAAATAVTFPAIMSLAVIGAVVVLHRLSYDVTSPEGPVAVSAESEPSAKDLLPITINFALVMLSLPVLAVVWGITVGELNELWTRFLAGFSLGETRISPSNFLTFIVVFMVGILITRIVKTTLKTTVMPRTKMDLGGQNAVVAGFGYVGTFVSALVAFGIAGIDLSSLAIVAGALSVGIGFGLQNIVSNFVSGIILLIERPIGEGDMIEVGGQMGYVRDISVRSTRIETFDRTDVIIPNAELVSNQVTNWTRGNLVGRVILPVGVAYGTDTAKVTEILRGVAESHPLVLINPAPSVLLVGFGADSIDFEIRAIIRDVNFGLSVKSEMFHAIVEEFDAAGIEIPFAQRDIWLRNPEAISPKGEGA